MAKKKVLEKPQVHTKKFYDYNECRDYLEAKYKYDERDYKGMFAGKDVNEAVPYQDFWHWVIEHNEVHNGCFITFSKECIDDEYTKAEDWVKEIYNHYLDEFADENDEIEFYVWW